MPYRSTTWYLMNIVIIAALSAVFVSLVAVILLQERNYATGRNNNTYLQTITCVISTTPTQRTNEYVKACYDKAEHENNVQIKHFYK
jgi:hypothetical protein